MKERCCKCGYAGGADLCEREGHKLCYECVLIEDGKDTVEQHHVLGRQNDDLTILVPANFHRVLTRLQRDWPASLRTNVGRDPLLTLAAVLRSFADFAGYAEHHFRRFSDWLIALQHAFVEFFGPRWWTKLDVGPLWA